MVGKLELNIDAPNDKYCVIFSLPSTKLAQLVEKDPLHTLFTYNLMMQGAVVVV